MAKTEAYACFALRSIVSLFTATAGFLISTFSCFSDEDLHLLHEGVIHRSGTSGV